MSERMPRHRDMRLLPIAVAVWAVAYMSTYWESAAATIAVVGAVLSVAVLVASRWVPFGLVAVVLAAAAASACHVAMAEPLRSDVRELGIDGGRALVVTATLTAKPSGGVGSRVDAVADEIAMGQARVAAGVPVTLMVANPGADWQPGARVRVTGTAFEAGPGERSVLVVRGTADSTVLHAAEGAAAVTAGLRLSLVQSTSGLPPPAAALIPGLAVGDDSGVSDDLDAAMKTASLSHLTAVSGANCAIVTGLGFAMAALLGASRGVRVVVALAVLAGFVLLVTPEPSVVRAATMGGIAMLAVLLGRIGAGVSVLSLAVTVCLIADPWLSTELGFALSAAATAALILLAGPLAAGMARWMPPALALALAVPLAAQLACGPLLVLVDARVSLVGVLANLLAAPAAPAATIVGLAACLAAPVPLLQQGLTALAWVPAAWISSTAQTLSGLPSAAIPWPEGLFGTALLVVVSAALTVLLLPVPPRLFRLGALAMTVVLGVGIGGSLLQGIAARLTTPAEAAVIACDVGQGDALIVRSDGSAMLIDTGMDADALGQCLTRLGIERINILVLTHFDADHVGAVGAVVGRVDTVLFGPTDSPEDEAIINGLAAAGAETVLVSSGTSGQLGVANWRVLWPRAESRAFEAGNDSSVVVAVSGGGIPSVLMLGDLSAAAQRGLLASDTLGTFDVVKVAHHGSADQEPRVYEEAAASVAVVSVGADNTYGHPRDEILDVLAGLGTRVLRTDERGMVAVWRSGGSMVTWSERGPPST